MAAKGTAPYIYVLFCVDQDIKDALKGRRWALTGQSGRFILKCVLAVVVFAHNNIIGQSQSEFWIGPSSPCSLSAHYLSLLLGTYCGGAIIWSRIRNSAVQLKSYCEMTFITIYFIYGFERHYSPPTTCAQCSTTTTPSNGTACISGGCNTVQEEEKGDSARRTRQHIYCWLLVVKDHELIQNHLQTSVCARLKRRFYGDWVSLGRSWHTYISTCGINFKW